MATIETRSPRQELRVSRPVDPATPRQRRSGARVARKVLSLVPVAVLALVIAWAIAPGIFTSYDPHASVADRLIEPGAAHWFGTDEQGRDLYSRVVYGTSESVKAVVIAVLVGLLAGSFLGLIAGYLGGLVDDIVMRIVDVLLAVPALLISLAFITALGFGTINIAIAVGIGNIAAFSRIMRSEVLKIKQMAYIEATTFSGISQAHVLRRHVVPNALGPVFVLASLELGMALLAVSALSFLGFGAPPPAPEWGSLVSAGRDYLAVAWWMTTLPGLVIAVTVLSANWLARAGQRGGRVALS